MLVADFEFDTDGRANVAALDNGATNPNIARQVGGFERIIEGVAARIANEGMIGGAVLVFGAEFVEITDEFELARAIGSLAREGPVAGNYGGRARRKANDNSRNVFACGEVPDEEIRRRPGFGELCQRGNYGMIGVCMG